MVDGYLKIKTKIDNKDIDKGVVEIENKIKKLQEDNTKSSTEQSGLQEEINQYEKLHQEAEQYKNKIKELKAEKDAMFKSNRNLAVELDTPEYSNIKIQIEEMRQKYAQVNAEIDKQAPKIEKVYVKLDKVKAKQSENNAKIAQFKQKIDQINLKKVQNGIDGVGKGIQNSIGKLGKMTLAVIGIRTAFGAVKSAISAVSQYNPQIAADFEYMKYCISNMLLPVIQKLISLLYTVLSYVNAIASAWFGINLFGNSSAKNFKKMQNSASGTAKALKEANKHTQTFDEMNIASDNSSSDSGASSGAVAPSVDLSGMQAEAPAWLQWIIDNKDLIIATLSGIAGGILAVKLGIEGIKALGIGVLIAGIVYTIQSLLDYLKNPSWNNFGKIIQGIGVAIVGLGILIGSVPVAVAGAIVLIIGTITKYWEEIKGFFQGGIDWLTEKSDWVHEMFGDTIGNIYDMFVDNLQQLLNFFDSIFTMIKGIFDGLIKFITGVFTGDWNKAWEGIKQIFTSIWEGIKGVFTSVITIIKNMVVTVARTTGDIISGAFKAVVNAVLGAIEGILNTPIRAINGLIGVINKVPRN